MVFTSVHSRKKSTRLVADGFLVQNSATYSFENIFLAGGIRKKHFRPAGFGKIFSAGRRDSENNFRAKKTKCGSN